jgi:hypothetical protein
LIKSAQNDLQQSWNSAENFRAFFGAFSEVADAAVRDRVHDRAQVDVGEGARHLVPSPGTLAECNPGEG